MLNHKPDRICYSFGSKVPGAQEYSSINVQVSYESDVRDGETLGEAIERIRAFVHEQCDGSLPAGEAVSRKPEYFDPANRRHVEEASRHFDHAGVKSEDRRRFYCTRLLPGKPMDRLGEIIQQEAENFRQRGPQPPREPFKVRSRIRDGGRYG